ncbi:transglutaminase-like domain-containing protein [Thiovibrio sp. JS02]
MKTKFILWTLVCALFSATAAQGAEVAGRMVMEVDLSAHPAGQEARLWIPYPVSSPEQEISDIRVTGDFAESAVYADRQHQTPILYVRWNKGSSSRKMEFSYTAVRQEVGRRDFPKKESPWSADDYREWLAPTSLAPLDGPVGTLAREITRGKKTVLAKARAIYDWTCENMYRDPDTRGCGKGDVCSLLQKPGGKCTDIHSVFVALCRAAGVPAREIFGIRMGKEPVVDVTGWQHCWAEFYLPGYGWVPVDPADVRKAMLTKGLPLEHPEIVTLRNYYWGGWDAYRVELSRGRDVRLSPAQAGEPLNNFGYPYAELDGKHLDWLDSRNFHYAITYRQQDNREQ